MKSISSLFFRPELRRGPFFLNFTDLHQSNLLVDKEWNIKCLIDLEWSCSRPVEMMHPPYWLTNQAVDGIDQNEYEKLHGEFMEVFKEEERKSCPQARISLSQILEQGWQIGTFWYSLALDSPTGIFTLFYEHIQPRFEKKHIDDPVFFTIMQSYWCMNAANFIRKKVQDKETYDERLRAEFEN
ncbi:hypothetical protein Plec18167_004444 [Paecilomyces lecythidis]|uniref:Aminoglycoside phosphotransferase domain-containing protein n=1 Tax=Paecilomyces lecythidis TaxID=3004212 RepID=A0ABR3XQW2_9EURO